MAGLILLPALVIRDLTEQLGVKDAPIYNKMETVTILVKKLFDEVMIHGAMTQERLESARKEFTSTLKNIHGVTSKKGLQAAGEEFDIAYVVILIQLYSKQVSTTKFTTYPRL